MPEASKNTAWGGDLPQKSQSGLSADTEIHRIFSVPWFKNDSM